MRLQLNRIGDRIRANQNAAFSYDRGVVDHIVGLCNDPDSGGRMIDNIVTNSLLPDLSRGFLDKALKGEAVAGVKVRMEEESSKYDWRCNIFRGNRSIFTYFAYIA